MTDPQRSAKEDAARRAVDLVEPGMVLGLGTGSTAALVVRELGARLADGRLRDIVGVPTSEATHREATAAGVPLTTLDDHPDLDLTIDGADEVDPEGNLIKGLGGALLREKIVAFQTRRLAIVVDASKLVERLGLRAPLPVEIVPFGGAVHLPFFASLGTRPALRLGPDGTPFISDGGHHIVDLTFAGGIADPAALDAVLSRRPGIIETGLFLGREPEVIVGRPAA